METDFIQEETLVNFSSGATCILTLCKYAFGCSLIQGDSFTWIAMRYPGCALHSGGGYPLPFICTQQCLIHRRGVSSRYVHVNSNSSLGADNQNVFTQWMHRCKIRGWEERCSKTTKTQMFLWPSTHSATSYSRSYHFYLWTCRSLGDLLWYLFALKKHWPREGKLI